MKKIILILMLLTTSVNAQWFEGTNYFTRDGDTVKLKDGYIMDYLVVDSFLVNYVGTTSTVEATYEYLYKKERGVGTETNNSFGIYTNDLQRVTVLGDGKVGIGTRNPSQLLQVRGGSIDADVIGGYRINTNLAFYQEGTTGIYNIGAIGDDWSHIFRTRTGGVTYNTLTIKSNNVGIGTITPTTAKTVISGTTLTGSSSEGVLDMTQNWNTTGTPTAIKLNVTNTASNSASLLMDLQVGGSSRFNVSNTGDLNLNWAANVNAGFRRGTVDNDITGLFMRSPNGTLYYLYIDDSGTVTTTTTAF